MVDAMAVYECQNKDFDGDDVDDYGDDEDDNDEDVEKNSYDGEERNGDKDDHVMKTCTNIEVVKLNPQTTQMPSTIYSIYQKHLSTTFS